MKKLLLFLNLVLLTTSCSAARTITGKVFDSQNNPLPGVNVIVKGTSNSTTTDLQGLFSISVTDNNAVLVFSFIGYKPKELKVGSTSQINLILDQEEMKLEEVVVAGYGSHKKSDVTGAVASEMYSSAVSCNNVYYSPQPEVSDEGYANVKENGFKTPVQSPLSTFSIDVDAASYSNIRRFINQGSMPPADAVRVEEMVNYFDYDYPQPEGEHPFKIIYELGECPWNKDNKLLHIGLQGKKLTNNEMPASNIVFLIDVSGSMSDENKLPLLKKAFKLLVSQLRKEDKVAIVVYAGSSGLVLPSTPGDKKDLILASLDQLQSGGSTAGSAGLKLAYKVAEDNFIQNGNNRIIIATDGDFNVGPSSNSEMEQMIVKYREKGIFISVAGFGMGNYKDDKMEIIADKGNGNYSYIDNLMEAKKVFINEFGSTLFTISKDVKIQIEFNPAYVAEYRLVGYENRLLNEEDFDNDKKDAGELGSGHTVTALYEIVPAGCSHSYVRKLKYQKSEEIVVPKGNGEFASIKFRYKKPDGTKSILMEETIPNATEDLNSASNNFKFSAAVAGFGMLLRNSEYKGNIDFDTLLNLARSAKGNDYDGYRTEFINLVELAKHL
jgi:Ca-activated chloride channel family protein